MFGATMDRLTNLPPEILRHITKYLKIPSLSKEKLAVFEKPNDELPLSKLLEIPSAAEELDLSAFQLLRTSKSMRNIMLDILWDVETTKFTTHQLDKLVYKTLNHEHNAQQWINIAKVTKQPRDTYRACSQGLALPPVLVWMESTYRAAHAVLKAMGSTRFSLSSGVVEIDLIIELMAGR